MLIIAGLGISLLVGGWYGWDYLRLGGIGSSYTISASAGPGEASSSNTFSIPDGYMPYSNSQFHFSVYYPPNLQLHTYHEDGGAFTVALQDPTTNAGFEVYVTPFSGTQIDAARFKLDEPSGTFLDPTNVLIAGTRATMFFGSNPIMGDTREVWFIKDGLLYEVTTYKPLDAWLSQIMQTWQFI